MRDNSTEHLSALDALAETLWRERDDILEKWRIAVASSGDETLVETLSRREFYDNIPGFLERLCDRLRGDSSARTAPARQHGAHRWQQGLRFDEIIHEWGVLHRILLDHIGALWQPTGLAAESLPGVYGIIAESVQKAIETSLTEYHVRQRAQANTRVLDLEAALEHHKDVDYARGRGLHHAAHDLRGSLQTVRISCHLLQRQQLGDETRVIVDRLQEAINSLNFLFNDLLDLARLEAGREQRNLIDIDAAGIFRELAAASLPRAQAKGLELITRGKNSLIVCSDPAKLRRIAQNLISNALDYTSAGVIEIGWYVESSENWAFYVQDSGPGMKLVEDNPMAANLEQAEHAIAETSGFSEDTAPDAERGTNFRQSGRQAQGEGVGLAIVHQLCELLDAVIKIDSESGRGTTLRVQFPRRYENSSESAPDQAPEG